MNDRTTNHSGRQIPRRPLFPDGMEDRLLMHAGMVCVRSRALPLEEASALLPRYQMHFADAEVVLAPKLRQSDPQLAWIVFRPDSPAMCQYLHDLMQARQWDTCVRERDQMQVALHSGLREGDMLRATVTGRLDRKTGVRGVYTVRGRSCTCPWYCERLAGAGILCKHILRAMLERQALLVLRGSNKFRTSTIDTRRKVEQR